MNNNYIAIVTNYLPALSATFIYKEVIALKDKGININTYSTRKPKREEISKEAYELYGETKYLLPVNWAQFLLAHVYFLSYCPIKYIYTLIFLLTRKYNNMFKDRLRTFFHFAEGIYLAKLLKDDERNINHIHSHYANMSTTLSMVAAYLLDISFSFTAHAYDIYGDDLINYYKIKCSKFIITCTLNGKNKLIEINNVIDDKDIHVVYHGVDIEKFKPIQNKSYLNNKVNILNIGRLSKEKSQEDIILVCERLKDMNFPFECTIVGDGPYKDKLQKMIMEKNMESYITLAGKVFQEDILKYYQNADVFLLTSREENLPNVLLESLSAGVPVITTNVGAIPELIKNMQTGILVAPGDIRQMIEAIILLYNDNQLMEKLRINGIKCVSENFNFNNSINDIMNIYKKYNII